MATGKKAEKINAARYWKRAPTWEAIRAYASLDIDARRDALLAARLAQAETSPPTARDVTAIVVPPIGITLAFLGVAAKPSGTTIAPGVFIWTVGFILIA